MTSERQILRTIYEHIILELHQPCSWKTKYNDQFWIETPEYKVWTGFGVHARPGFSIFIQGDKLHINPMRASIGPRRSAELRLNSSTVIIDLNDPTALNQLEELCQPNKLLKLS
jgi:hypothetical protein